MVSAGDFPHPLAPPEIIRDDPTNEAEQIVDNSVVQRSVIVLKSGMPFRTGKQVGKTWVSIQLVGSSCFDRAMNTT